MRRELNASIARRVCETKPCDERIAIFGENQQYNAVHFL
jgi:hypothetical protein